MVSSHILCIKCLDSGVWWWYICRGDINFGSAGAEEAAHGRVRKKQCWGQNLTASCSDSHYLLLQDTYVYRGAMRFALQVCSISAIRLCPTSFSLSVFSFYLNCRRTSQSSCENSLYSLCFFGTIWVLWIKWIVTKLADFGGDVVWGCEVSQKKCQGIPDGFAHAKYAPKTSARRVQQHVLRHLYVFSAHWRPSITRCSFKLPCTYAARQYGVLKLSNFSSCCRDKTVRNEKNHPVPKLCQPWYLFTLKLNRDPTTELLVLDPSRLLQWLHPPTHPSPRSLLTLTSSLHRPPILFLCPHFL